MSKVKGQPPAVKGYSALIQHRRIATMAQKHNIKASYIYSALIQHRRIATHQCSYWRRLGCRLFSPYPA